MYDKLEAVADDKAVVGSDEAGIGCSGVADDSAGVSVHGAFPLAWLKVVVVLANLVVWCDAALRLAG